MSHDFEDYGIEILKDIPIRCSYCSCRFFISTKELERNECYDRGPMGDRITYHFYADSECPQCGHIIKYTQEASEYPQGAIEYITLPICYGGEVLNNPEVDFPYYSDELYISDDLFESTFFSSKPVPLQPWQKLEISVSNGIAHIDNHLHIPNRSTTLWVNPAGTLLPILLDETKSINIEENGATFAEILQRNPEASAIRLLGKVAEAVIVRNCINNAELNRIWLSRARKNQTSARIAEQFQPIGTGLYSTKNKYKQKYNPSEPQRDIIWINNHGDYALVSNRQTVAGMTAGLQIKVSGNGMNYVLKALKCGRYEVPLVYFPMNDDYERILEKVNNPNIIIKPGIDFIDVREVDMSAFYDIIDYYPLLVDLYSGQLTANDFIREATGIPVLQNSILASTLSTSKTNVRILY